jgi:hypothetical protein
MRLFALASVLFVASVTLTATFAPRSPLLRLVERLPGDDTTAHFLLLGVTAFALTLAFTRPGLQLHWRQLVPAGLLLLAATADELSQLAIRSRSFALGDLGANYAGIVVFTSLALAWRRARRPAPKAPDTDEARTPA